MKISLPHFHKKGLKDKVKDKLPLPHKKRRGVVLTFALRLLLFVSVFIAGYVAAKVHTLLFLNSNLPILP